MKCLILAAGYATRLYPLTENFPKPLLAVGDKNILEWIIDDLETTGRIDEYVIVSNHRFVEHFRRWAAERGGKITILDDGTMSNDTRLGAVRDIELAIETLGLDDDLLILAGDNVLEFSLAGFLEYADARQTSCVMRYFEPSDARLLRSGEVSVNEDDLVVHMEEKPEAPQSHWVTPAFYVLRRADVPLVKTAIVDGCGAEVSGESNSALDRMSSNASSQVYVPAAVDSMMKVPIAEASQFDAPGSLFAWLSQRVPIHALLMPGRRFDIGTLESYEQVKREYRGVELL